MNSNFDFSLRLGADLVNWAYMRLVRMTAWKRLFTFTLFLLILFSALRILFFAYNRTLFEQTEPDFLILAMVEGLRFDLAVIAMLNGILFCIYMVPRFRGKLTFLVIASTVLNGFALHLNAVDAEYFKFTGKRLTMDSFAIARDIGDQFFSVVAYYWQLSLAVFLVYIIIAFVSYRAFRKQEGSHWWFCIPIMALTALGARGGWQPKPLIPAHAYAAGSTELGALILNSPFTVLKSSDKAPVHELEVLDADTVRSALAVNQLNGLPALSGEWPKPKNVLVIVLESFGSEYVFPPEGQPGYAPFLRELAEKTSSFPRAYANGRRSIDALPALLAGIPAWMEPPFITSPYQTNRIVGAPQLFKANGYETLFFHGGMNGTMFFDVMTRRLGFDHYIGNSEYPDRKDFDGRWGIFDEPFLQFVSQQLTQQTKPFFASVFTLSSHHPYTIPSQHTGRFPKGTLEIHETVGYADYALRMFFETARKQPWYKDTLIVITADHTSKQEYPQNDNLLGRFHVPLIFSYNDQPLPFVSTDRLVQHADLAATVVDLGRIPVREFSHFGQSLCRKDERPGIVLFESGSYSLVRSGSSLTWSPDAAPAAAPGSSTQSTDINGQNAEEQALLYLKASAQSYNNGMVRNQLIW